MPEFGETKTHLHEILVRLNRDETFHAAHVARVTEKWDGDEWLFKSKVLQDVSADDLAGLFGDSTAKLVDALAKVARLSMDLDGVAIEYAGFKQRAETEIAALKAALHEAELRAAASDAKVGEAGVKADEQAQVIAEQAGKLEKSGMAIAAMQAALAQAEADRIARDARIAELTSGQPAP